MNHIELFAGCGGMSLGFKSCGFDLLIANEVSPMAAETFSYNIMGKDIRENPDALWLESNHPREEIELRLRENLLFTQSFTDCDILDDDSDLKGKLIIGNIIRLIEKIPNLKKRLGVDDIDVISGGPPCQGFSMAGLRKVEDQKNQLPFVFANFVDIMRPKVVVLENVTGILRPFINGEEKYYAWKELATYFYSLGYYPICLHVNPVMISLPQTRLRFIMIAIRNDIKMSTELEEVLKLIIKTEEKEHFEPTLIDLTTKGKIDKLDKKTKVAFHQFISQEPHLKTVTAQQAIHDIFTTSDQSAYVKFINSIFNPCHDISHIKHIQNLETPKYSNKIIKRIKLQQVINALNSTEIRLIRNYLKGRIDKDELIEVYGQNLVLKTLASNFNDFVEYLDDVKTKKHSQRALYRNKPSPTITAMADDFVHYEAPRCLNVREMARIQSFPDWFVLRSKITTGGLKRKYEIPQQTQVGNAVPPMLGRRIAMFIKNHLLSGE